MRFCLAWVRRTTTATLRHNVSRRQMATATVMPAPPKWGYTAEDIERLAGEAMDKHKASLDQIGKQQQFTYATVLQPLSLANARLTCATSPLIFLTNVSASKEVREASFEVEKRLNDYKNDSLTREDVFRALKGVHAKDLDGEDARLVTMLMRKRIRAGLDLTPEKRADLLKILKQIDELKAIFQKNCSDSDAKLKLPEADFEGTPDDVIQGFEKTIEDDVVYRTMTFKTPDYVPVLRNCHNPETRKTAWQGYESRVKGNDGLIEKAASLRFQASQLLGFKTWADYRLQIAMAQTPGAVNGFIESLRQKLLPIAHQEQRALLEMRRKQRLERGLPDDAQEMIPAWDYTFLDETFKKETLVLDQTLVKQHFPVSHVVQATLEIYQEVFDLQFDKIEADVWHTEVIAYAVSDAECKDFLGYFYLDLFPREGKYSHAAVFDLLPAFTDEEGKTKTAAAAMVANLAKNTSDKAALMSHDDVVTFFHELGHAVHLLCAKPKHSLFNAFGVEGDFVECPSQMLENWCYDPQVLKRMSKHYETGAPLPDDLIEKLIQSRKLNQGLFNLRQSFFCVFDMQIHSSTDGKVGDTTQLWTDLLPKISLRTTNGIRDPGDTSFAHLMGGYDAGYYGYLWSLVYSSDLFTRFEKNPMDKKEGKRYRDVVLGSGATADAMDILVKYLGRPPNDDAFLKQLLPAS